MRRKDKEITRRSEMDEIIKTARVCRLAMLDGSRPYIVPLSFGYDGSALYFHSAPTGKKIDLLRKGGAVCFELEAAVAAAPADMPCKWGMAYRSIIGDGRVEFIDAPEARRRALDIIMAHYSDRPSFEYTDAELRRVSVFRVVIGEMTGKRSE
jgi:nitroimidazol reductase NimA-like FMN-containing flavoprotein (pyridoxamine 5'-phosphate oxidase superfamily)